MNKNRIRLTEPQLQRVIKESVKNVLNEVADTYDCDEHNELIEEVRSGAYELQNAIRNLAKYYLANVEGDNDMYNSYAGKYSEEAQRLINYAISRLGNMMESQYE
ncbi:MAG: hypothetical protein MJY81_07505 [Bacteroidaceae bacterium]|nr:hypothetical protein [Bacteroidaceae bacterium]